MIRWTRDHYRIVKAACVLAIIGLVAMLGGASYVAWMFFTALRRVS